MVAGIDQVSLAGTGGVRPPNFELTRRKRGNASNC